MLYEMTDVSNFKNPLLAEMMAHSYVLVIDEYKSIKNILANTYRKQFYKHFKKEQFLIKQLDFHLGPMVRPPVESTESGWKIQVLKADDGLSRENERDRSNLRKVETVQRFIFELVIAVLRVRKSQSPDTDLLPSLLN